MQNQDNIPGGRPAPVNDELLEDVVELLEEIVDLEQCACANRRPPHARRYRIKIDRDYFTVDVKSMTGRELLLLAGRNPPERFMISQKPHGGPPKQITLDESVDFTTPGIEKFLTLPLDQTEG
jgi:hypothetical protein